MLKKYLLLCRKALTRYQMLFRHMFYCKHVERLLCNVWISNKDFKQYSLRSPKWWVCVKFRSVNLKNRFHTPRPADVQVCRCVCPQTAHAQLCAEHPVLHDVWGDGAQLAHYGEQPEDGKLTTQEMHKFHVKCDPFWPNSPPLQASNIDDVLCHHTSFLDNCLKDCMLTNPELLRIFSKLMAVCVMFTNCMQVCEQRKKNIITAIINY